MLVYIQCIILQMTHFSCRAVRIFYLKANETNLDYISIAEFINKGFVYHPNTFYEDIKTLDNGLVIKYKCKCNDIVKTKYFEIKFNIDQKYKLLKKRLTRSLKNAIHGRTVNHYGNKACFLSGGGGF